MHNHPLSSERFASVLSELCVARKQLRSAGNGFYMIMQFTFTLSPAFFFLSFFFFK